MQTLKLILVPFVHLKIFEPRQYYIWIIFPQLWIILETFGCLPIIEIKLKTGLYLRLILPVVKQINW